LKDKILNYINKNKNWIVDKVIEIASVNTINTPPSGNENNGQDILMEIFRGMDLEIDRFSPDSVPGFKESDIYLKGRDYTNRDNLVGFIGHSNTPTIIFNGHIDTVPSHMFTWTKTKPFEPKLINNKIYGLGVSDMKGGIISSIYALKSIIDLNIPIKGKVIIESVVDEEFGGANGSLACVKKGYTGDFAIIAEPTSMNICISNVSSKVIEVRISGSKGLNYFGDKTESISPILIAADLIHSLKDYEEFLNSKKDKYMVYRSIEKPINFLFSDIIAGDIAPDKIITNPEECKIRAYLMNYSDVNRDDFMNMMLAFIKKNPSLENYIKNGIIVFEDKHRFIEGGDLNLAIPKNKKFIQSIVENGKKMAKKELKTSAALGGTDFFAFNNYGHTPVVVLGPGGGNLHAADEYVNLSDLIDLSKIYAGLIYDYCC